jgi:hypothetical protein
MQPAIHQEKNPDIYRFDVRLFGAMYCGLHFLFRRAHLFLVNHPVCIFINLETMKSNRRVRSDHFSYHLVTCCTCLINNLFMNNHYFYYVKNLGFKSFIEQLHNMDVRICCK